jgi:hypothetical protein
MSNCSYCSLSYLPISNSHEFSIVNAIIVPKQKITKHHVRRLMISILMVTTYYTCIYISILMLSRECLYSLCIYSYHIILLAGVPYSIPHTTKHLTELPDISNDLWLVISAYPSLQFLLKMKLDRIGQR